jgi:nitroreductase
MAEKIFEAGQWALFGGNGQPWEFIVVNNQETKNEMSEAWAEIKPEGDAIK